MHKIYEGAVRKGRFYPKGSIDVIPDSPRVILTILDEIPQNTDSTQFTDALNESYIVNKEAEDRSIEQRRSWLMQLSAAITQSLDENLPDIQRSVDMREPIRISD